MEVILFFMQTRELVAFKENKEQDKLLVLFFSDLALHNKRREHDSHSAGLL